MIIIGGSAVHPLYTRVIISRSCILAEFAISRFSVSNFIQPSTEFFSPDYGRFRIDSVTRQGETYIVRAYDPLAYHAKYCVCRNGFESDGIKHYEDKPATTLYNLISGQSSASTLSNYKVSILPPADDLSELKVRLDVRYDMLFDAYSQIPEAFDPTCRLSISNPPSYTGNTVYQPEYGSEAPVVLTQPQIVDYSYHATAPGVAVVAGKGQGGSRSTTTVIDGDSRIETYVNAPFSSSSAELKIFGQNALSSAKAESENITVKMMTKDVPGNLKPAGKVRFAFNPGTLYMVQSVEYTTSPAGDIAYISCGGRVMSVADRINALIAADYAARY